MTTPTLARPWVTTVRSATRTLVPRWATHATVVMVTRGTSPALVFRSKFGNFITIKAIAGVFQMCEGVEAAVNAVRADGSGLSVGKKYCVFF